MKIFRIILLRIFDVFFGNSNSRQVDPNERITRYIFQKKGRYSSQNMTVKYNAYMPASDGNSSVYRTQKLSAIEIWEIGVEFVEKRRRDGKKILARADLQASEIFKHKLQIIPEENPHKLHANLTEWPIEKSERVLIALTLAQGSELHIK